MLVTVWFLVGVLVAVNWLYWRYPPQSDLVNDLIIGGASAALLLVLGWLAITLYTVPMAREGMVIALIVVLCVGGVLRLAAAVANGWRPSVRLSVPFHAAWPRPRYQRRYASDVANWVVEEVDE